MTTVNVKLSSAQLRDLLTYGSVTATATDSDVAVKVSTGVEKDEDEILASLEAIENLANETKTILQTAAAE